MPADDSDQISGFLSNIFPGPGFFPAPDAPAISNYITPIRSRLCEIIWLEPALFHITQTDPVILLTEEHYPILSTRLRRPITPGTLGEQIVIRGIHPRNLIAGATLIIGDASFKVITPPDPDSPLYPACSLQFLEEGLAEPGALVVIETDSK